MRYLFSYSSNGFLEIQWYLFGALVFLGASHTLRLNEHVRVDLVYSSVSDRARLWIDALGFVLFFLPVTIYLT
jgi:TRAP-type mannitol/chloroaromatic compound transport system permease small subunit